MVLSLVAAFVAPSLVDTVFATTSFECDEVSGGGGGPDRTKEFKTPGKALCIPEKAKVPFEEVPPNR